MKDFNSENLNETSDKNRFIEFSLGQEDYAIP